MKYFFASYLILCPSGVAKKKYVGPKIICFLVQQVLLYNRALMHFDWLLNTVSEVEDDVNFKQGKEGGR